MKKFSLQKEVELALKEGKTTIRLPAGTYELEDFTTIETSSIAHDDGCGEIKTKDCHLYLKDLHGLTLEGECGPDGTPLTVLAGKNTQVPQTLLPSILWAEGCGGLTLKNLAFTREPECASAGIVESVSGDEIRVKVFPDLPCREDMPAYCMNRFDPKSRKLLGESLTFGFGYDNCFQRIGEHELLLKDERIAGQVKAGEGLSFHQSGKTDFQLFFGNCDGLTLQNIRIYNTNGFGLLTENCRDIQAEKLVLKPKGSQFFTGPRDGWKIYRCTGDILLKDCWIEGVRMDGQNIHSNFMIAEEVLSRRSLRCVCKYAPIPLRSGYEMEFYRDAGYQTCRIADWEITGTYQEETVQKENPTAQAAVTHCSHGMTAYRIDFSEPIPEFVEKGTLMTPRCWEPERYRCRNSTFLNIAGAGHLLRCGEAEISGCRYENMMNAGILIGAEFDTHCEGGHGVHVQIHHNVFDGCGTKERYGIYGCGCISVKSQGFCAPVNQDIKIWENDFKNSRLALEICDAGDVLIRDNRYENIEMKYKTEEKSTQRIVIDE